MVKEITIKYYTHYTRFRNLTPIFAGFKEQKIFEHDIWSPIFQLENTRLQTISLLEIFKMETKLISLYDSALMKD